jgi:selenocysteine lyase/cysteine desulfurase
MPTPSWEEARGWFPLLDRLAYLNAASMSPLAEPVARAGEAFLERCIHQEVSHSEEVGLHHMEGLRARLSSFLGCEAGELAFTSSTSEGIIRAAEALRWKRGDNVVVPAGSFPALVYPWFPLREDGVEVRVVEAKDGVWASEEEVLAAADRRTRVVAVSWVSFRTGNRYDLAALGEGCRALGALLCVDGMQGVGALGVDLGGSGVDFLAFQPVKWIPAPSGLGIFFCRKELLPELRTRHLGWTSAARQGLEDLTDFGLPPWPTARRYEGGSVPPLQVICLEAALELLMRLGAERTEERVQRLGGLLAGGLEARGYRVVTPLEPARRAGITAFEACDPHGLVERLREAGIVVAVREGRIRASTHFYNDEGDVERLLEALPPP